MTQDETDPPAYPNGGVDFHDVTIEGYIPDRRTLLRWFFTRRHSAPFIRVEGGGETDFTTPFRVTGGSLSIQDSQIICPPDTTYALFRGRMFEWPSPCPIRTTRTTGPSGSPDCP